MWSARLEPAWDFAAWRDAARVALRARIPPEDIDWCAEAGGLLGATSIAEAKSVCDAPAVSGGFLRLAQTVVAHRDPHRHALLYRLAWRIAAGDADLLDHETDPDVRRARQLEKAVHRDVHKMHAFVRFRAVPDAADTFVAWYQPDHFIVDLAAPFFMRRFAGMRWAIFTPYRSAAWDGAVLAMGEGGDAATMPSSDAGEALWRRYYASIFNPARLNTKAMRAEMPSRFWRHLPEARELPQLVRDAASRVEAMVAREPEAPRRHVPAPLPAVHATGDGLDGVHAAVRACRNCPLWEPATQTVPGSGPADARIVFIGEQPGDEEDLRGEPFTGPAGRLFDRALADVGIERGSVYVTNAVKHFKFELRGKRRIHVRANAAEQAACRGWLQRELGTVRPERIVCLGATAAQAVLGRDFALMRERGRWHRAGDGTPVLATVHPSWVLRQRSVDAEAAYAGLVADLSRLGEAFAT